MFLLPCCSFKEGRTSILHLFLWFSLLFCTLALYLWLCCPTSCWKETSVVDCSFMRHPPDRSPLDWVETSVRESPSVGCASNSGLSCDDVWSLVYSSGLSWDDLRWSPALYSSGLSWVGLRWSPALYSCGLSWVGLRWYSYGLSWVIYWVGCPCGWAQVDVSLVVEHWWTCEILAILSESKIYL